MTTATYEDLRRAMEGERLPALLVDLDAFDRNVDRVVRALATAAKSHPGLKLRIATKSLRIPALLKRAHARGGERMVESGVMCFAVEEARLLARHGFHDLFVAYPTTRSSDLERAIQLVASGIDLSLAIDCEEHALRISRLAARLPGTIRFRVVICADMSVRLGGLHLGVRRSPIANAKDAVALARFASRLPKLEVHGLMGYEAQVAGLADNRPDDPSRWAKRMVRRASVPIVRRRRRAMVDALRKDGHRLSMVNGGGTGSLDSSARDETLTEVACGSAFFKPHTFDDFTDPHVRELEPSCFFALEVCRIPAPGFVTCLGGGYVASGPPGPWSAPRPWLPSNVELLPTEMAGEVQTPLRTQLNHQHHRARGEQHSLTIGDPVFFRHAKAGEIAERFTEALLIRDGCIVDRVPTYRGMGACFF